MRQSDEIVTSTFTEGDAQENNWGLNTVQSIDNKSEILVWNQISWRRVDHMKSNFEFTIYTIYLTYYYTIASIPVSMR